MIQNMARAHVKQECIIAELQTSIHDELYILKLGSHTEPSATLPPTPSIHYSVGKVTATKGTIQCPFCKGPHIASLFEKNH